MRNNTYRDNREDNYYINLCHRLVLPFDRYDRFGCYNVRGYRFVPRWFVPFVHTHSFLLFALSNQIMWNPRLMGARDLYERLAEGERVRYPVGYREWSVANAEPVRPRMYKVKPYIGVEHYLPELLEELRALPDFPVGLTLAQMLQHANPFVIKLRNPNRVALMVPTPDGWKEESAIFCSTPRRWQFFEGRFSALRDLYPRGYLVSFTHPYLVQHQPRP